MFGKKGKIITDEKIIDEILSRSVDSIYPSKDELKKEFLSGKRLRIYHGADATGSQLHLGHSTNFILMEKLRELGHEIIILFGDFTARIGDPTDKSATRVRLTKEEVAENVKSWKKQIKNIINFDDFKNRPKIVYNKDWLGKLTFEDVIELSANFTVQQMLERDMFQNRLKEEKPIYVHEFFYPLMQGYDSVELDVDMEIGGTDQTFNMLAGRTLLSKIKNKNKFVLTTTLLENPATGQKLMSKSQGGYIALNDSPTDMFGKVMALADEVLVQMFIDTTLVSLDEINQIKSDLESNKTNPKDIKVRLAKEIVKIYHGKEEADSAAENFDKAFSKGEVPEDVLEVNSEAGKKLVDILLENEIIKSKSEWRRLIEQGGISSVESGEKISDLDFEISETATYRIGKKRFVKVNVKR